VWFGSDFFDLSRTLANSGTKEDSFVLAGSFDSFSDPK
jgi:hypothetical protein